jgi:hypothetical protein
MPAKPLRLLAGLVSTYAQEHAVIIQVRDTGAALPMIIDESGIR